MPARKQQKANQGTTDQNQGGTCFWGLVANETLYAARLVCGGPVATAPAVATAVATALVLTDIGLDTVVHDRGSAAACIRTAFKHAPRLTDVCERLVDVLSSDGFGNVASERVTEVRVGIASPESPVSRTQMELRGAGCIEIEIGAREEYVTARLFDAGCSGATTWDVRLDATMLAVDPSGSSGVPLVPFF
jgi:hypothetical protein